MSTDPVKTESSLEEQLVAYLDGELDAEAVHRIEERLAAEPEVRESLNRLERTWDLLDELGSTPVGESFTRTTLEMVTVAAEEDVQHAIAAVPVRRRRRLWLTCAGVLTATAAGFLAAFLTLPNSNRQLLQDLPVLENLEEYRQVDDVKFLRLMKENGLFPKANPPVKEHPQVENMTSAEMAEWVDHLPPGDKSDLLQKKDIFDKFSPLEQKSLRDLHETIQNDGDAAELNRIMHDYYEWWKSLPPYPRNELSSLSSPQDRIKQIEQLKQEELKRNPAEILSKEDTTVLRNWMEQYLKKVETRYRLSLLEPERKKWDAQPELQRRRKIAGIMFPHRGQGGGNITLKLPEDLAELSNKLSSDAQHQLADKPPEEQWRKIQSWLFLIARQQFAARMMGRRPGSLVDENELADFFDSPSLSDQERMRLLNLPPEDMQHELQRMYLSWKEPMGTILGRPEGMPPGPPRGPRDNPSWRPPDRPEKAPDKPQSESVPKS